MLCFCCAFSHTFSALPFRLQDPVDWETRGGSGRAKKGQNEARPGHHGRQQQHRTVPGGRCARQVHLILCIFALFLLTSSTRLLLSGCLFSAEFNNMRGGTEHDQRLRQKQRGTGERRARLLFFFVLLFFLIFTLLPNYFLFREVGFDRKHGGMF